MSFKDIALPLAMKGVPVIRLMPKSKIPLDKAWQNLATTDVDKILAWDAETPNCNCGCVAKPDGVLFLETDQPGVIKRYVEETGQKFSTLTVSSRKDRFHFYFRQTDRSREVGQIKQGPGGISFGSLRQNNAYVVAPGSIHPETGLPYSVVVDGPIAPIPESLLNWLVKEAKGNNSGQKLQNASEAPRELVPHGQIHAALVSEAGRLRKFGHEPEAIVDTLIAWAHTNCEAPIDEHKVKQIALSMANYKVEDPRLNELTKVDANVEIIPAGAEAVVEEKVPETFEYPYWVFNGTLYEDFATLCGENNLVSKEYFIEAVKTVVGAICGHRITPFKAPSQESRFYTILIGPGGSGKSSATKWAKELFASTGLLYDLNGTGGYSNVGAATGNFASSSGLIKNGFQKHERILQVYDEASTLIEKFGITGSGDSFLDAVNQLYESGNMPQLTTKDTKEVVTKLVHNSILGCTTKEKWAAAFSKTNAESSGFFQRLNIITNENEETVADWKEPDLSVLREQFVKKIQPLEYQTVVVKKEADAIDLLESWFKSKRDEWRKLPIDITGRLQVLINRNASHIAWLSSGDQTPDPTAKEPIEVICDYDIMERAIALSEYEVMARMAHQPAVGRNEHAIVENLIKSMLSVKVRMHRSKLYDSIHAERFGIRIFDGAVTNLTNEGLIKIAKREGETKRGRKALIVEWVGNEE